MEWTLAEENTVRLMLETHSNAEIGAAVGRSERAVMLKLHRMGLRRRHEYSDYISTTIALSPLMKAELQALADAREVSIGSIIREILAAKLGMADERTIAVKGGMSRKPRVKLVNNQMTPPATGKPSMPFVNIGRD